MVWVAEQENPFKVGTLFKFKLGNGLFEYPKISKDAFERRFKGLMKKRIEVVSNALLSNFWFSIVNRLFIRGKIYNEVESVIVNELNEAELLKKWF